jgi:hypothetical protein
LPLADQDFWPKHTYIPKPKTLTLNPKPYTLNPKLNPKP